MTATPSFAPATLLAIDPGREKCGVCIVRPVDERRLKDSILHREIVPTPDLPPRVRALTAEFLVELVLIGDGTGAGAVQKAIAALLPPEIPLKIVSEKDSTRKARSLYFLLNPAHGWRRLIPIDLQTPPCPVDDYAALVLAAEYLGIEY